jgi:hypothetical protein
MRAFMRRVTRDRDKYTSNLQCHARAEGGVRRCSLQEEADTGKFAQLDA